MLIPRRRWLAALTLLWLLAPARLLHLAGLNPFELSSGRHVLEIRVLLLVLLAGTVGFTYLHVRAHEGRRPVAKAAGISVLLALLWWAAWLWTLEGGRGSGVALAVPLALAALVAGGVATSEPADR